MNHHATRLLLVGIVLFFVCLPMVRAVSESATVTSSEPLNTYPEMGNRAESFSVPEFSFPAFVLAMLGFAALNLMRRFLKK